MYAGLDLLSLGFPSPSDTTLVVAMSGGVDSSVTAALLHEAGFKVIGITLNLYDYGQITQKKGACCAGQDVYDASLVAQKLGFPHYVFDYENLFKESVMDDFVESYSRGETPIPCIRCNQKVKFRDLFKAAKDLGAHGLATGHYVQRISRPAFSELHQGASSDKDQSYFLFTTTQEQLDFLRFPIGHMKKEETRYHAHRFDLTVADKPDSQDICFVPNGNYAAAIEKLRPGSLEKGNICDQEGSILGTHDGIINFTIGQRKGLNLSNLSSLSKSTVQAPLYVIHLDHKTHTVTVGPREALAKSYIFVKEVNWLAPELSLDTLPCSVKIRSSQKQLNARITNDHKQQTTYVTLEEPEYGVAPGQACVFYQGSRVLGGGWITSSPETIV